MRLIRRRPRAPAALLPLEVPRLDGTTWPDRRDLGRTSFAASTLYQMGYREAFTAQAHAITDLLLDQVVPLLRTDAASEDEPYLRQVFCAAVQIGAGIGAVERRTVQGNELGTDRQIAGALRVAGDDLPAMPVHQQGIALYLMHCGYYLARTDLTQIPLLVAALRSENGRGVEPGP